MERTRTPYGLEIIQSCLSCPVREQSLFCNLSPQALQELNSIRQSSVYPKGAVLFVEGQPAGGLFVVCEGKVKLTTASPQGRRAILRVAEAGEVLGLSAVMSNTAYEASAETLEPIQANFLPRDAFLRFLQGHGEISLRVAQHLSTELRRAYHQVVLIGLMPTARAKLAGLLLDWASRESPSGDSKAIRFQLRLTHEEIGELIGVSRETVTRLLGEFRRKGLIRTKGAWVTVPELAGLKTLLT